MRNSAEFTRDQRGAKGDHNPEQHQQLAYNIQQ
jgi:hypothetical protein